MKTFLLFLAMTCTPVALVLAWAWVDEWLADLGDRRRRAEQKRVADAEWFALLAVTGPSLAAHPAADRIRDQIAANEAARIDDEWKAWTE